MNQSPVAQSTLTPPRTSAVGRLRWWTVWTFFLSEVTNYLGRETFSVRALVITAKLHDSHTDLAPLFGSFQISYALTSPPGGVALEAIGTRIRLALAVVFWSAVNVFTGLANSVFGLAESGFLPGIGEGFNWPGTSETVAEWFPSRECSLAVVNFDRGSSVDAALARILSPSSPRGGIQRWLHLAAARNVWGMRWGFASSSTMVLAFPSDLLPQDVAATFSRLSGLAAGLVGAAFTFSVGMIADRFSCRLVFLVAGIMAVFATVCVLTFIRRPHAALSQELYAADF